MLSRSDDDEGGWRPTFASLGLLLVAPIAATLLQLAVSRSREYGADATGAELCGDPDALANALLKLERGAELMPYDRAPATSHLFIVNPLSGGGVMKLFSTHPPIPERVRRLREMGGRRGAAGNRRALPRGLGEHGLARPGPRGRASSASNFSKGFSSISRSVLASTPAWKPSMKR